MKETLKKRFIGTLVLILLGAILLVPSQVSAASSTIYQTTAAFDTGNKSDSTLYFWNNGVDQPSNYIAYPNAEYYQGRTYVTWQAENNYSIYVTYYDHNSKNWATPVRAIPGGTKNPVSGDGHGSPSLVVDVTGTVHLFCCAHDTRIQHYKANGASSISSWTNKTSSGMNNGTYPHPVRIGSTLFLFYRGFPPGLGTSPWQVISSTDNGETWTAQFGYLDLSAAPGTAYVGGTDVYADQIHQALVMYDQALGGDRKNAYEIWYNATTGHVFCYPNQDFGTVITFAEISNAGCRADDTIASGLLTNFASVHLDSNHNPYMIYRRGTNINSPYQVRFATFNGASWVTSLIRWTGNHQNYDDFVVNSATSIDAFITANTTGNTHEGGDMEVWHWNGAIWSYTQTIMREGSSGKPLAAPIVPRNHNDEFQVYFNQRHFDFDSAFDFNYARLFAWGKTGFLANDHLLFGVHGVETNTDNPMVAANTLQLASTTGDSFGGGGTTDSVTFRWGNITVPKYGNGMNPPSGINWNTSHRSIVNGKLNMSIQSSSSVVYIGVPANVSLIGNWDVSVVVHYALPAPGFTSNWEFDMLNEQCASAFQSPICTTTVSGIGVWFTGGTAGVEGLRSFTTTNGVPTQIGGRTTPIGNPVEMRITKSGTTITWYHRDTPGSGGWTTDQTTTFATATNLYPHFNIGTNDNLKPAYFDFSSYKVNVGTVAPFGFRQVGTWTSPITAFTAEIVSSVLVDYIGATSSRFINKVSVLASDGSVLYQDSTHWTSGTTATITIPDDQQINLHGFDYKVRVYVQGDTQGSIVISKITINTVRSTITIATNDAPWLLGFFALLTLGLVGAFAIRRKRGGRR